MAKKSLIAGEYIIEIADNGHVDVVRVFRNAMVVMEEIAKSKNFEVNPKWNTQDIGRHLVKEFGDGKSAQFKDITINKFPDGKIEIYQECKNVIDVLRTIAQQLEFPYDEGWNTQTFGSKISDYLIEHKEEADKILQTKNAKRKKENVEETLNISTSFDISATNKSNNTIDMAKFNLTAGKTAGELKKEFNEAFGSKLKVYNKNKIADDAVTLGELGLKADSEFECRANRTAGSFIAAFAELGLKVKIYTQDEWVAVLPGLTLEATGKVKKNATKADMEGMEGYQREESTSENSSQTLEDEIPSGTFTKWDYSRVSIGRDSYDESGIIELYKEGKAEVLKKILKNWIYDLRHEIDDIVCDENEEIDYNEDCGAIYSNNLVIDGDSYFGWKFEFPCTFIVVAQGKVMDKIIIEEEPETAEGYLFTEIPYDYDIEEAKERLEDDDCEWLENDMISLMGELEGNDWMHSYEVGDLGDGLYVSDLDSYLYAVVLGDETVYELE